MKLLANDGISQSAIELFEKEGFEINSTKVAQEQLANYINENNITGLLVRSATEAKKELVDACPNLKLIGRGGVGMDNIDVDYAKSKGIHVVNTPASSSQSVAELVFAHLLSGSRFLHDSNRNMPLDGDTKFKQLKKSYAQGAELRGRTLGIIGFGRIGQATAKMAIGMGMNVLYNDHHTNEVSLEIPFFDGQKMSFELQNSSVDTVLKESDFVSVHVPAQNGYILGKKEFEMMKPTAGVVNASRGGVLDEVALVEALDNEKIAFAGLDVFESEPKPEIRILMHPKISMSPHIGASTQEAQDRIGVELATQVIKLLK
ncbi:D-2-hydroxyacid dehydrogenase [Flagellimonas allohymeniacidonis]|uniref:3-phosphoglycerate dehydrogenase n=1 Tax=Flagellimonas allohymeniacidonis TaxID=2517819 RepID=A0A4Q8QMG6_9FLAO|nr:D-2-hydroxyacid dehydrogenase [Allomuricauda hymeniacidonis]TAI49809.1 3-phosphoglycerate dehydrogenase [Allomuricauda hymeniacidonis]